MGGSTRLGATRGTGRETGFARGASTAAGGAGPGSDWNRSVCEKATDGANTAQTITIDTSREPPIRAMSGSLSTRQGALIMLSRRLCVDNDPIFSA